MMKDLLIRIIVVTLGAGLLVYVLRAIVFGGTIDYLSPDSIGAMIIFPCIPGLLGMSYGFIRYQNFIAREFHFKVLLVIFFALSTALTVLPPSVPALTILCIPIFGITAILVTTMITLIISRWENSVSTWMLTLFFSFHALALCFIPFEFSYRHIGGGNFGLLVLMLAGGVLTVIVSFFVNLKYKNRLS